MLYCARHLQALIRSKQARMWIDGERNDNKRYGLNSDTVGYYILISYTFELVQYFWNFDRFTLVLTFTFAFILHPSPPSPTRGVCGLATPENRSSFPPAERLPLHPEVHYQSAISRSQKSRYQTRSSTPPRHGSDKDSVALQGVVGEAGSLKISIKVD
jgi:hypothetical protein